MHEVDEIGSTGGGCVAQLSFSAVERAGKDLVASCAEEAGLAVREDAGNPVGRCGERGRKQSA